MNKNYIRHMVILIVSYAVGTSPNNIKLDTSLWLGLGYVIQTP
jgi:hypothetical protein